MFTPYAVGVEDIAAHEGSPHNVLHSSSVGMVVTLRTYAQHIYAFGCVGLCTYVHLIMYICRQKTGCLVPYHSKIFC